MKMDDHKAFQRMIDESLAGVLSVQKEQSLRDHLSTCATCSDYLSASNRVIAGLSGFSFEVNPALNAKVLAALNLKTQQVSAAQAGRQRFMRRPSVPFKVWVAFAAALLMAFTGSALVYQVAKLLAIRMHFDTAQVQAGVLVFWLLPSLCAALCLLAAPAEKRGMA